MSSEDNQENVRKGYDAFMKGDAEGALATLTDDAEYIITGDNTVAGTYRGKEEIAGFWGQLGEKEFQVAPREFIADGDKVVVPRHLQRGWRQRGRRRCPDLQQRWSDHALRVFWRG